MTSIDFWDNFGYWRERLGDIYTHIKSGMAEEENPFCRKGIIVEIGEGTESRFDFVKDYLKVSELMEEGKVSELAITDDWDGDILPTESNENSKECWNTIIDRAFEVKDGLLILSVSNMKLFEHCWWHIKQLAKQENDLVAWNSAEEPRFHFNGYVLLVLDGLDWESVRRQSMRSQAGEFEAAMQFYSRIKF